MEEKTLEALQQSVKGKEHRKILSVKMGILPILLVVIAIFAIVSPKFRTFANFMNIFRATSINLVVAVGMTFIILTGGIDLSVGSIAAIAAVVALKISLSSMPFLAVPIALLIGIIAGMLNGVLISYAGIPPFIATLGAMTYLRGFAFLLAEGVSIINSSLNFAWIGNGYLGPFPWLMIIAFLVVIIAAWISRKTAYGMKVYAVGGNPEAAKYTGIKVKKILLSVYVISGLASALSGVMIASRMYSANGLIGQGYELDAIASVVIGGTSLSGGKGSILGTLFGAIFMGVLNNWMTLMGISYYWQQVVRGAVIIAAVIVDVLRTKFSEK